MTLGLADRGSKAHVCGSIPVRTAGLGLETEVCSAETTGELQVVTGPSGGSGHWAGAREEVAKVTCRFLVRMCG